MILVCDTCGRTLYIDYTMCVDCSNYQDEIGYCDSYEALVSASFLNLNPKNRSQCSGFAMLCECEGLMKKQ
jgi:hypothetical protein